MPPNPARGSPQRVGGGLIGGYTRSPAGVLRFEGPRPGPDWHRHDWRVRQVAVVSDAGLQTTPVERRRWRLRGTTSTHLDRSPDEVGGTHAVLLVVFLKLGAWLLSPDGLHVYEERLPALDAAGSRRSVQRWLHRLLPDADRVQGALRTAVVERSEPQPIERLFPGGVSPPGAVRRRRWKNPEATYRLATGLAFLVQGADALSTSVTVLLAEARKGLDGPLGISRR